MTGKNIVRSSMNRVKKRVKRVRRLPLMSLKKSKCELLILKFKILIYINLIYVELQVLRKKVKFL
jgi:hypothetical protein